VAEVEVTNPTEDPLDYGLVEFWDPNPLHQVALELLTSDLLRAGITDGIERRRRGARGLHHRRRPRALHAPAGAGHRGCLGHRAGAMTTPMVLPLGSVARYRVLFADCDPMRIMYYASYFRLFEIGRAELFRGLGHCFADYVNRGLYLAVVSATCRYRRPARYDDELEIRCGVRALGRARITIAYEIARDGEVVVDGETEHALVDDDGKPQRLPADFRALLAPGA
jgi:acyl-CoA thioester hydrolase